MTHLRIIPLALALAAASTLIGCATSAAMPMGAAPAHSMSTPGHMASMDAQMKTMRDMHDRMMAAKTPEERSALMAEHRKAMHGGMAMMGGMGDMKPMPGMSGEMAAHHQMMAKRMEMMQSMMQMMMEHMAAAPGH